MPPDAPSPFAQPTAEVAAGLGVDSSSGLSEAEARERLGASGPNRLAEERRETVFRVFLEEIREPMILLLLATGVLYSVWGKAPDAVTIFVVILALVGTEVANERRAGRAIEALRELAEPVAAVRREGRVRQVPAEEIVPGDFVLLEAGRRVPADIRLTEVHSLTADESLLTGESVPVDKEAGIVLPSSTPLAERVNLAFAGTTIAQGSGAGVAVATGMRTEMGHVADLARRVKPPRTPLQKAMRELTRTLVWLALGFSVLIPALGYFVAGEPLREMVLTGLSLAFATIPEELPIIITMVLALGAFRLSRDRAIVKRLRAVETLGAVTVIATDKTGTLTENRMELERLYPERMTGNLLELGVICNDTPADSELEFADPMDAALLRAARRAEIDVRRLRLVHPVIADFTFDGERKLVSVVVEDRAGPRGIVKGAPEAVLARSAYQNAAEVMVPLSDAARTEILGVASRMAEGGLRVIAFADRTAPGRGSVREDVETGLVFVGLAGFADPPRPEASGAVEECRAAGIRPLMVTGDHPQTAMAIARRIGLAEDSRMLTGPDLDALSDDELREEARRVSVFARTTPEHKLRIVDALHSDGERVAVTGDGINDAPALAAADIGVAMGETGTDVARETADIVLADDNFATIVRAVEQGRLLFANLRKGVRYYLACKVALIATTLLPVLLGVPVPFAPIQIIVMELFMDLAASATFVAERPESDLLRRAPRDPAAPFMDRGMIRSIFGAAAGLFAAVSAAYLVSWYSGAGPERAHTVAFATWLIGHVLLAFNLRSEREPLHRIGLFSNRLLLAWAAATFLFLLVATLVPAAHTLLRTAAPTGAEWLLSIGAAYAGTFWIELVKLFRRSE